MDDRKSILNGATFPLKENANNQLRATMQFTPTVAGTYTMIINDNNTNALGKDGAFGDSLTVDAAPPTTPNTGS